MVSVPCKEAIEVMLEVYEPLRVESTPLAAHSRVREYKVTCWLNA